MTTRYTASCDCGWTGGPYRTEGIADYAHRQHSCDAQRRRDDAATRNQARLARLATIDRTPKPCTHPDERGQPRHRHGTYVAYTLDRCRCRPCADASSAYERDRVRRNAYGRSDLTDATPVREHIATLTAAGIGLKSITRATGINGGVMSKLVYGIPDQRPPSKRVRTATASKILALDPRDATLLADGAKVNGTGTRRRIEALGTLGWSVSQLATTTQVDRQRIDGAMAGRDVLAATHRAIATLYDRLWDRPAPTGTKGERVAATRTRRLAEREGWAPPLAWDDETIDDPGATPFVGDVTDITTAGRGRVNTDSLTDCAIEWGMTIEQAAVRLSVSRDAIYQGLIRLPGGDDDQRAALRAAFARNATAQGLDRPTRDGLGLDRRRSA